MTPIVCARRSGSLDCVKQILKKSKINLSMKGRKKNPLIEAAEYGHYEINLINYINLFFYKIH